MHTRTYECGFFLTQVIIETMKEFLIKIGGYILWGYNQTNSQREGAHAFYRGCGYSDDSLRFLKLLGD